MCLYIEPKPHWKKCSKSLVTSKCESKHNNPYILPHTNQYGLYQELRWQQMLVRMWRQRNTPPLLLGLHPGTTTLVISLDILLKIVNSSSWKPSYTTFEHISKICPTIPQGYLLHYAHRALLVIARSWTTQKSLNKEWIQKIWFITQWNTTPLLRIRTSWVFQANGWNWKISSWVR